FHVDIPLPRNHYFLTRYLIFTSADTHFHYCATKKSFIIDLDDSSKNTIMDNSIVKYITKTLIKESFSSKELNNYRFHLYSADLTSHTSLKNISSTCLIHFISHTIFKIVFSTI